jgi:hypothetical protein
MRHAYICSYCIDRGLLLYAISPVLWTKKNTLSLDSSQKRLSNVWMPSHPSTHWHIQLMWCCVHAMYYLIWNPMLGNDPPLYRAIETVATRVDSINVRNHTKSVQSPYLLCSGSLSSSARALVVWNIAIWSYTLILNVHHAAIPGSVRR